MAIGPLYSVRLFVGGADITSRSNQCELTSDVEELDVTCFQAEDATNVGWKEVIAGLRSSAITASGFWEAGDDSKVDDNMWAGLGSVHPITVGPTGAAVGDLAWVMQGMRAHYQTFGAVGVAAPYSFSAAGTSALARGVILNAPSTTLTTTTSGTAVEYVAASSTQRLYANLHVLSVSGTGPKMTVKVQSDVDGDFNSVTDQITFTEATAISSEYKSTAGAIADTFFRVSVTTAGTSPSFLAVVSIGIK